MAWYDTQGQHVTWSSYSVYTQRQITWNTRISNICLGCVGQHGKLSSAHVHVDGHVDTTLVGYNTWALQHCGPLQRNAFRMMKIEWLLGTCVWRLVLRSGDRNLTNWHECIVETRLQAAFCFFLTWIVCVDHIWWYPIISDHLLPELACIPLCKIWMLMGQDWTRGFRIASKGQMPMLRFACLMPRFNANNMINFPSELNNLSGPSRVPENQSSCEFSRQLQTGGMSQTFGFWQIHIHMVIGPYTWFFATSFKCTIW